MSNINQLKSQVTELMQSAVQNDNTAWGQVNDAANLAGTVPATPSDAKDLIDCMTAIAELSFGLKAANSASLARFMAANSTGLKVAINGKKKSVKITIKKDAEIVDFTPQGDWAHFKGEPPAQKSFQDKIIATMKREIAKESGLTADDMKQLDWNSIIDQANK